MSSNPLVPSFRLPSKIPDGVVHPTVKKAIENAVNGIVDLNQAIVALNSKVEAIPTTTTTTTTTNTEETSGVTEFNSETGDVIYFPDLLAVNNQLGNPIYMTQTSDAGAKIIVGDSSPVTVNLNSSVTKPWGAIIDNDSSSSAALVPVSGTLYGAQAIPPGGFGIVCFDGINWWCGATKIFIPQTATCSQLGYVEPDCVSIGIAAGVISTIGIDSSVVTAKLTSGGTEGVLVFENGLLVSSVQAT